MATETVTGHPLSRAEAEANNNAVAFITWLSENHPGAFVALCRWSQTKSLQSGGLVPEAHRKYGKIQGCVAPRPAELSRVAEKRIAFDQSTGQYHFDATPYSVQ